VIEQTLSDNHYKHATFLYQKMNGKIKVAFSISVGLSFQEKKVSLVGLLGLKKE